LRWKVPSPLYFEYVGVAGRDLPETMVQILELHWLAVVVQLEWYRFGNQELVLDGGELEVASWYSDPDRY